MFFPEHTTADASAARRMSGICGIVAFDGRPAESEVVSAMAKAAAHRAPDGFRVQCDGPVGMAHLALVITPEDVHDQQPGLREGVWIVADARLDNLDELARLPFVDPRERLTTGSALHAAYRHWGALCVDHLIGDYAFVVWDGRSKRFFAARDPSGVRSLYYRAEPTRLLFGTEVRQILAAPDVPVAMYEPAIAGYLAGGYTRPEWSFFDGIAQLPPGHVLEVADGRVDVQRFWDPTAGPSVRYRRTDEYAEHFRDLLEKAVRCRIRSTRPVGVLLSGGVDSGSVTSMAAHLLRRDPALAPALRPYSFAFAELRQSDERDVSRAIVAEYDLMGTDVPGDDAWPLSDYPAHGPMSDSPFAWVYQRLMGRCVSRAREDGAALVLTGEGGDELLGDGIFDLRGIGAGLRLPTLVQEVRALAGARESTSWDVLRRELFRPALRSLGRMIGWRPEPSADGALGRRPWIDPSLAERTDLATMIRDDPKHDWGRLSPRERRSLRLSSPHLPRLLSWQEQLHAHAGVGAAMPLADQRLVRYVLSIPQWVVNAPSEPKRLARDAVRGIMPETARRGARKVVPTSLYERGMNERGVDVLRDLLLGRELTRHGLADATVLKQHLEAHLRGEAPTYDIWWAATMEWWLRAHWSAA